VSGNRNWVGGCSQTPHPPEALRPWLIKGAKGRTRWFREEAFAFPRKAVKDGGQVRNPVSRPGFPRILRPGSYPRGTASLGILSWSFAGIPSFFMSCWCIGDKVTEDFQSIAVSVSVAWGTVAWGTIADLGSIFTRGPRAAANGQRPNGPQPNRHRLPFDQNQSF